MKTHPSSRPLRGFTLIELLVVMAIMAILTGLYMGGYSYLTRKQAEEQTHIQISLLSKALEDYKSDNGEYPETGLGDPPTSKVLYDALYGNGLGDDPIGKIYLAELDPNNKRQGWVEASAAGVFQKLVDPWGREYIYRRGDHTDAVNPDFDLASPGKDGILGNADDIDNY